MFALPRRPRFLSHRLLYPCSLNPLSFHFILGRVPCFLPFSQCLQFLLASFPLNHSHYTPMHGPDDLFARIAFVTFRNLVINTPWLVYLYFLFPPFSPFLFPFSFFFFSPPLVILFSPSTTIRGGSRTVDQRLAYPVVFGLELGQHFAMGTGEFKGGTGITDTYVAHRLP